MSEGRVLFEQGGLETQREAKTKMLITFMGALLLGMNAIEISVGTSRGRDR